MLANARDTHNAKTSPRRKGFGNLLIDIGTFSGNAPHMYARIFIHVGLLPTVWYPSQNKIQ